MAHNQPFYGKLSGVTPASDNIVAITGDTTVGVNQIANIAAFDPSFNIDLLRVGQILNDIQGAFGGGNVTITNIAGTTLTVNTNAASSQTGFIYTADTADGVYLIQSASFFDPQNFLSVNDITGSNDSNFDGSTPTYAFIGQAATGTQASPGSAIPGRFHQYKITDVVYRDPGTSELSVFVQWNEDSTQSASGDTLYMGSAQALPLVGLTATASLATIFNPFIAGLSDITVGGDVAAYQQALPDFFESLAAGGGITILNNADNRLTTATGNVNELNAEANLTFDGTTFTVNAIEAVRSGGGTSITTGTTQLVSFPVSSGKSANYNYVLYDGSGNSRAGIIIAVWDGTVSSYNDFSTPDLNGSTEDVTFTVTISGGNVLLNSEVSSGTWNVDVASKVIF